MTEPVHIPAGSPALQSWDDPRHGGVGYRLLVDADWGPSRGVTQGVVEFAPGDRENLHRHPSHCETIHVLAGHGQAELPGRSLPLSPGDTVFVPAGVPHAWSAPDSEMRLLFTFPADRLDDVTYDFETPA